MTEGGITAVFSQNRRVLYSLGRQVVKKVWLNVSLMFHSRWANTAAAIMPKQEMASKGTLTKKINQPYSQPDAPDCKR